MSTRRLRSSHLKNAVLLSLLCTFLASRRCTVMSTPELCGTIENETSYLGYREWETLKEDIEYENRTNTSFTICPDTWMVLNENSTSLKISKDVIISCGLNGTISDNCTIAGGSGHFLISGEKVLKMELYGLSMQNSDMASIERVRNDGSTITDDDVSVSLFNSTPACVLFLINCEWVGNIGNKAGAIHISEDMLVVFDDCLFIDNGSFSAVYVETGEAVIQRSLFSRTQGSAIWVSESGALSISDSCLLDNLQAVTIESDSSLEGSENNYGRNNLLGGGACEGFFLLEDASCLPFDADTCLLESSPSLRPSLSFSPTISAKPSVEPSGSPSRTPSVFPTYSHSPTISKTPSFAPTSSPSNRPTISMNPTDSHAPTRYYCLDGSEGYFYWKSLVEDVQASNGDETFVICANIKFNPYAITYDKYRASDITIYRNNITIQCGQDGSSENECIFEGGLSHFFIGGSASNIHIKGITMKDATESAILAYGSTIGSVTFEDCYFINNQGTLGSAITARNDVLVGATAMTVEVIDCEFRFNVSPLATILSYGPLNLERSIITSTTTDNSDQGWAVIMGDTGTLSMSGTCIENNHNSIYFLDKAVLALNDKNFGRNNTSGIGSCEGIYLSGRSECVKLESDWCPLFPAPSSYPSNTPSRRPIGPPTIPPTATPTHSAIPTNSPSLPVNSGVSISSTGLCGTWCLFVLACHGVKYLLFV